MKITSLGSGSGGNCTLFECDGTSLLVDAGFGPRETARRIAAAGASIEDLAAILITHEHSDHIHGAAKIARKYGIPVWVTDGTLKASRLDPSEIPVRVFENNTEFRIGNLSVRARRIIHDAADPCCFVIEAGDGTRAGLASDLGFVDPPVLQHLTNCDALLFESNHDLDMLRSGSYPWSLKRRIMSNHGHLSNDDAMAALRRMLGPETRELCLIHLSEKNNHASIVEMMGSALLDSLGAPVRLSIAAQKTPLPAIEVRRRVASPRAAAPAPAGQMALF